MVPVDKDAAASVAPEPSASGTAASNEGAEDMSMSWYLTIPGIGTVGLDATGIPSNDQEILEAVTEWVFANPSLLYAIVLDLPVSRQDGDAGGSAPSTAPEAEEGVLGESAASAESATIAPRPRLLERPQTCPYSSLQRQPWSRPHLRWLARSRKLSGERSYRPPSLLSPPWRRFRRRASPPQSLRSTMPPRARQEPPPPKSTTPPRAQQEPPPVEGEFPST
jgi:hypothetical protein